MFEWLEIAKHKPETNGGVGLSSGWSKQLLFVMAGRVHAGQYCDNGFFYGREGCHGEFHTGYSSRVTRDQHLRDIAQWFKPADEVKFWAPFPAPPTGNGESNG